jgi:hypothetical protein
MAAVWEPDDLDRKTVDGARLAGEIRQRRHESEHFHALYAVERSEVGAESCQYIEPAEPGCCMTFLDGEPFSHVTPDAGVTRLPTAETREECHLTGLVLEIAICTTAGGGVRAGAVRRASKLSTTMVFPSSGIGRGSIKG